LSKLVFIGKKNKRESSRDKIKFNSGVQNIPDEKMGEYKTLMTQAIEMMGLNVEYYIIYDTPIPPPKDFKPKSSSKYCPYCGTVHKFKQGEFGDRVCPICGVSLNEFYTKKYNKMEEMK
jgi:NADH pyrophosphatase zinc ribbon domain.